MANGQWPMASVASDSHLRVLLMPSQVHHAAGHIASVARADLGLRRRGGALLPVRAAASSPVPLASDALPCCLAACAPATDR